MDASDFRDAAQETFGVPLDDLVLTRQGHPVRWDDPAKQIVDPVDLFEAVRRIRRWGGHADWTVLQHSVLCKRVATYLWPGNTQVIARAAAHDLHEAYTGDIPGPAKNHLGAFRMKEYLFERRVAEYLGLTSPSELIKARVKACDIYALNAEARVLGMNSTWVARQTLGREVAKAHVDHAEIVMQDMRENPQEDKDLWTELAVAVKEAQLEPN